MKSLASRIVSSRRYNELKSLDQTGIKGALKLVSDFFFLHLRNKLPEMHVERQKLLDKLLNMPSIDVIKQERDPVAIANFYQEFRSIEVEINNIDITNVCKNRHSNAIDAGRYEILEKIFWCGHSMVKSNNDDLENVEIIDHTLIRREIMLMRISSELREVFGSVCCYQKEREEFMADLSASLADMNVGEIAIGEENTEQSQEGLIGAWRKVSAMRVRAFRERLTPEEKAEQRAKDAARMREHMRDKRAAMTPEEKAEQRAKDAARRRELRHRQKAALGD